jgi:Ca2+/Na+ antiporter
MVTDYLLAAECVFFALSLLARSRRAGRGSVGLWVLAFAVTAVAALAGGTAHGFRLYLGEANGSLVWTVTVWSIGAGAVFLLLAGLRAALRPETHDQKDRKAGVSLLKKGIVVSAVGIVLMVSRVSLHPHFNQNDLYHVVQMVGLYCFYKGGVLLHGLN